MAHADLCFEFFGCAVLLPVFVEVFFAQFVVAVYKRAKITADNRFERGAAVKRVYFGLCGLAFLINLHTGFVARRIVFLHQRGVNKAVNALWVFGCACLRAIHGRFGATVARGLAENAVF